MTETKQYIVELWKAGQWVYSHYFTMKESAIWYMEKMRKTTYEMKLKEV